MTGLGRRTTACHFARSFISSCQLVTLTRCWWCQSIAAEFHLAFSSSLVVCTSGVASGGDGQVSTAHDLATAVAFASPAPPLVAHPSPSWCPHSGACPTGWVLGCLDGISSGRSSASWCHVASLARSLHRTEGQTLPYSQKLAFCWSCWGYDSWRHSSSTFGTLCQPSQAPLQLLSLPWHSDSPQCPGKRKTPLPPVLGPQCNGWLVPYLSVLTMLFNCEDLGLADIDLHAPPGHPACAVALSWFQQPG